MSENLVPEFDVDAVLASLTTEQKASLLDGEDFWHTQSIPDARIPAIMVTDGPHGLRKQEGAADHLGLNASVESTCFPPAVGIASSWNPDLVRRVGEALGDECREERVSVLLGPGINMKRTPLCGRNFEYYSEDPYLAGAIGAAFVQGVQSKGIGTSLKHFAANNQETERLTIDAQVDERTLREIYLPAFERVVTEAQPWTVMCSYNKVNGEYASQHPWLLTCVLRDEWGFTGLVVSDWGAVEDRAKGVVAGLDLEMPSSGGAGTAKVLEALAAGTLSEADLDRGARRVLHLVARAYDALHAPAVAFDRAAHHDLARTAATQSAVLLKNDDVLPLSPSGGRVAVIGEFARSPRFQGAGSSQVTPTRVDNALDALTAALPQREVTFAPGFTVDRDGDIDALREEAVAAAQNAAVAVVFVGLPPSYESEGFDRDHMHLPPEQVDLIRAVAAVNPRVAVVLSNGSPVTMAGWVEQVPAVLEAWLLGQAGGSATADLLTGAVSPTGHLGETLPIRLEDNPTVGNFPGENNAVRYGEGLLIGYRWYDAHHLDVSFPFGHGLTYTTFEIGEVAVDIERDGADPVVQVTTTVTNTGTVAAAEVVQVYVSDPEASVYRPEQELRGFARVDLEPGQRRTVTITLDARAFAFWHVDAQRFTVEGGDFVVRVGASSRDIRHSETITLSGETVLPPLELSSPLTSWLSHPDTDRWLRERLQGSSYADQLFAGELARMLQTMPVSRLARFPGFPISETELQAHAASRNEIE